jgi:hypothetical protein
MTANVKTKSVGTLPDGKIFGVFNQHSFGEVRVVRTPTSESRALNVRLPHRCDGKWRAVQTVSLEVGTEGSASGGVKVILVKHLR